MHGARHATPSRDAELRVQLGWPARHAVSVYAHILRITQRDERHR
eukprot:gene16143-53122_t